MANPVQPNRPWDLIQQNRRKLRALADPAQILAQTPEIIIPGATDRISGTPAGGLVPEWDTFAISNASTPVYALSASAYPSSEEVTLNGLRLSRSSYTVSGPTLTLGADVTLTVGDVLDVHYWTKNATISFIGSAQNQANASSVSCSVPSGRRRDDVLLAFVGRTPNIIVPDGWQALQDITSSANNDFLGCCRISDGTETSITFTSTGSGDWMSVSLGVYRGADPTSPIAASAPSAVYNLPWTYVFQPPVIRTSQVGLVVYGVLYDSSGAFGTDTIAPDPAVATRENVNVDTGRYSHVLCDEVPQTDPSTARSFSDPSSDTYTDHIWKGITVALRSRS